MLLKRNRFILLKRLPLQPLIEPDLFEKPVSAFPDHALNGPHCSGNGRDGKQQKRNQKDYLGETDRGGRYPAEPEHCRNQCDNKKRDDQIEHAFSSRSPGPVRIGAQQSDFSANAHCFEHNVCRRRKVPGRTHPSLIDPPQV
jgi:hypothetical protein